MDPFKDEDHMEESQMEESRMTAPYGSSSPLPMSPPRYAPQHVADPFEEDFDERDATARASATAPTQATDQASVSTLASTSLQRQQPAQRQQYQRPAQVNAAAASLLLSSSSIADDPVQDNPPPPPRSQAQRDTVRMGKMRDVSHDQDQTELSSDNEESRPVLPTSSQPATQRKRRKPKAHESITSLASIGRRFLSAAKDNAREDEQERGHNGLRVGTGAGTAAAKDIPSTARLNRREQALWMWANLDSIDDFLKEVYAYYTGKGFVCIALARGLNILTIGFVIAFSTFRCLDLLPTFPHIFHVFGYIKIIYIISCINQNEVKKIHPKKSIFLFFFLFYYHQKKNSCIGLGCYMCK